MKWKMIDYFLKTVIFQPRPNRSLLEEETVQIGIRETVDSTESTQRKEMTD